MRPSAFSTITLRESGADNLIYLYRLVNKRAMQSHFSYQTKGAASFPQDNHTASSSCTSTHTFLEEGWPLQVESVYLFDGQC